MAKCKVVLTKFKWNKDGYREIKNSSRVQAILGKKAKKVYDEAVRENDAPYRLLSHLGKAGDILVYVTTGNRKALNAQAKHKSLTLWP